MAEDLPLSESELKLLGAMLRHKVRFMVVGLSAAALQGAPVVTEAVDLWFEDLSDPKLSRALTEVGAAYVPPVGLNPPMLAGPGSEPFDVVLRMDGLDSFPEEFKDAVTIRVGNLRLKTLPLERILISKTAANRPKDKTVLTALKNALLTLNSQVSRPKLNQKAGRPHKKK